MTDSISVLRDKLRQLLSAGEQFSAFICGPYASGKTTLLAQAARDAVDGGLDLEDIAAFAPTRLMFNRLASVIAEPWPEFEAPSRELFPRDQRGVPFDALAAHTALDGEAAKGSWFERLAAKEWTDFCARTAESELDVDFLTGLKPKFKTALRVERHARLTRTPLPDNLYLHGVASFVEKIKREQGVIDRADILHADYHTSPHVKLLILDEVDEADRALVERLFPNASTIAAGLYSHESRTDSSFALDEIALRKPERVEVACEPVLAPPPPDDFQSLFVICPHWRRGAWWQWMKRYGIPPPHDWRWQATVDAWAYGGEIDAQAQATLDRYGTLEDLPRVRIASPPRLRGLEAEQAYVDLSRFPSNLAALASSRATRRLVVNLS